MVIKFCSFSLLCLSRKNAVPLEDRGCKGCQNPRIRLCRILGFWHTALVKQETGVQSQNSANAEFCSFCVFAGKNAVYLANQSCKDGKSEALCHKARHRGSRDALAHKNSLLTKRREPKPTNSACAEFANKNAGFIGGKTFQGGNRHNYPRIRLRRILGFCAFAKKNAVSLINQGCKGCQNEALCRKNEALC